VKTRTRAGLDSALRSLDAADGALTTGQRQHATATLDRILATPPAADACPSRGAAPRRRTRRRLLLVSAVAAAAGLAAAAVELPGGAGAYASWTPDPTALTAAELNLVAPVCRKGLSNSGDLDMQRARLVLSERRGQIVALLYRTDDPDMAGSCLMHNIPGTDDVEDLNWGVAGSSGPARTAPARGIIPGGSSTSREVTVTDGAVGAEVVAVTVHAPGNLTARATVKDGRYVVWWPGPDYDIADEGTARAQSIVTYDLTLADGTVIHDAPPAK
jgi:hypothetical protein